MTLVFGRIKEISLYDLKVSLIEGKTGIVKVYNISNRYRDLLESVIDGEQPRELAVLTDMFSVGQYLPCLVMLDKKPMLELSANPRDVNKNIPMHQLKSRMLLYGAIDSVEDHGYTVDLGIPGLSGFLPRAETLAYVARCNRGRQLCVGGLVPLRLLASDSDDGGGGLSAGLALGESRTARFTCDPARLMDLDGCAWPETVPCSFDCLTPGAWLRARVHRASSEAAGGRSCLVVQFQRSLLCTVPKSHLPRKLAEYRQGDPITLTLVSIDQSTKTLVASCLPHTQPPPNTSSSLLSPDDDGEDNGLKRKRRSISRKAEEQRGNDSPYDPSYHSFASVCVGQIVENATVRRVGKSGVTLWLPDARLLCLVGRGQLPSADDEAADAATAASEEPPKKKAKSAAAAEELRKKKKAKSKTGDSADLNVGDVTRVRVLDVSPMDSVAFGSMRPSLLELPFLRYEDAKPGEPVTGTLIKYCKEGAVLRIAPGIKGLVPRLHLSDYPIGGSASRESFSPGDRVKCRVLTAGASDRKLILTAKPKLVKSRERPVTRPGELIPGHLADCFIAKLDTNGILLVFYGSAKAWAPRTQLGLADSDTIEQVYYRGQVLRVRIIKAPVGDRLAVASLLMDGRKSVAESQAAKTRRQLYEQLGLRVGSRCACRILARSGRGAFRVSIEQLSSSSSATATTPLVEALLPFEHLTDQPAYVTVLAEARQVGDFVSPCIVWSADAGVVVSAKPSLVRLADASGAGGGGSAFPMDFESIEVGDLLMGATDQWMQYGLFVQLPAGFRGLVPLRAMTSEHPPFPVRDLFALGQTVVAKVIEKSEAKRRCLLSLRVRDCVRPAGADLADSLRLLEETLRLLDSGCVCPRDLLPGRLVAVVALDDAAAADDAGSRSFRLVDKSLHGKGFTCVADAGQLLGADCAPGTRQSALVLAASRAAKKSVSVCLRPDLLAALAAAESAATVADVSPGEAYQGEVLHAGADYRLVALRLGPTTQQIAFMPARRHWNESYSTASPSVGSRVQVVVQGFIKSDSDGRLYRLVALQSEVARAEGFRHLLAAGAAASDGAAAAAGKPGAKLSKREITIGEAFVVRIVAITRCQLNVEDLHSRTKGRIFVTEVTDSPKQMACPLDAFSVGQELLARVVGIRSDRCHEDPSHPLGGKRSNLYELSARPSVLSRRQGADFSDLFQVPAASAEMWLYVHQVDKKRRTVSLYAAIGKAISVPYLDVTSDIDKLSAMAKAIPSGTAVQAWRLPPPHTDRVTCLGAGVAEKPLKVGDRVATYVTSASQFVYRARLPCQRLGQMHAMDMHPDRPEDIADLCALAAWTHGIPTGASRRRAPFMLAEVMRVDSAVHWLRPVDATATTTAESAKSLTPSKPPLIGYVARQCGRGLAVTFGGAQRTGVVPVSGRARRLFPIGRRVRCRVEAEEHVEGEEGEGEHRRRPLLYRLDEPDLMSKLEGANKTAKEQPTTAESTATTSTKRRRRRRSSSTSAGAADAEEGGAAAATTTQSDGGVPVVVHGNRDSRVSGRYLPLELGDPAEGSNEGDAAGRDVSDEKSARKRRRVAEASREQFESLVSREPGNAGHWVDYSRFHGDAGELDSARETLERGLATVGRLGGGDAARCRLLRALLLLESRAAAANPDADPDRLTQATHRACQMDDSGLTGLAVGLLIERGEAEKAEAAVAKLRRARPDCPSAWRLHLEVKLRRGRSDDAKRLLFDQALPSLPKRHHLGLLSQFAELAHRYGRASDGEAAFEQLLKAHPTRPELYLSYARCLAARGGANAAAAVEDLLTRARAALPADCAQVATLAELAASASASAASAAEAATASAASHVLADLPLME